jgi:uncharacterized protein (DUF1501 family)
MKAFREIYAQPREGAAEIVRARAEELLPQIDRVHEAAQKMKDASAIQYPQSGFANGLRFVARAIEADLGARVYVISKGGFDTHANQKQQHQNLLADVADGLSAFQKDLEARGLASHVVTMTFSEFGRRVQENASAGTDHGAASALFIVGSGVKGGVYGEAPNLEKLDQGDLLWKIDFRQVYATVLEKWMGLAPEPILGAKFEALPAFREAEPALVAPEGHG